MPVARYMPKKWLPDQGEIDNPGYLEVLNVLPTANGWLIDARMTRRLAFLGSGQEDVLGFHIHPANGTDGWMIYVGFDGKIFSVDPGSGYAKVERSTGQTPSAIEGWLFVAFGSNEVAVGGHTQEALVRVNDTGDFEGLITNAQPDNIGFARCWQEDVSGAPDFVDITIDINDAGASDAMPFPAGAGTLDVFYLGRIGSLPAALSIKVGVAGVGGYALTWKFGSSGGAFTDLTNVVDGTDGLHNLGVNTVSWDAVSPTAPEAFAVNNSSDLFWIIAVRDDGTVTTDPKITQVGEFTAWPPQPKFVANFRDSVAIANIANVGPANEQGDPDPSLIWVSNRTGRTFGTTASNPGDRTTPIPLTDEHGPITGLVGGDEFGAVLKATAIYRVRYGGAFRLDIRVVTSSAGSIFPNAWAWAPAPKPTPEAAGGQELYLMTTAGLGVMTQSDFRVIGLDEWQRALFDETWVVPTYPQDQDQSKRYLCYITYSRVTDIVSCWYRSKDAPAIPENAMDMQLNYHRASGKASIGIRRVINNSGTALASGIYGAAVSPFAETQRFSGLKDVVLLARDTNDLVETKVILEADPKGTYKWDVLPTFTSPFIQLGQDQDPPPSGGAAKTRIKWVMPIYTMNTTANDPPEITVSVSPKQKPGEPVKPDNVRTTKREDDEGRYKFGGKMMAAFWIQLKIIYGNATGDGLEDMAEIQERISIGYEEGDIVDA